MKYIEIDSIDQMLGVASQLAINSKTFNFDKELDLVNSSCNDYTRRLSVLQSSAENLVDPKSVASEMSSSESAVEKMQECSVRYMLTELSNQLAKPDGLNGIRFVLSEEIYDKINDLVASAYGDMTQATLEAETALDLLNQHVNNQSEYAYNKASATVNFNTSAGITKKNYEKCLDNPTPEQREWAVATVNDMMRGFYGEDFYNRLIGEFVDLTEALKVNGVPAKTAYNTQDYSIVCCKFLKDMIGKQQELHINPMVKDSKGQYQPTKQTCAIESKEKDIPWWKKLFNKIADKFKSKESNKKMSFNDLANEQSASEITSLDTSIKEYTDKVKPFLEASEKHNEVIRNIDLYAIGPYTNNEPNEFFRSNKGIIGSMDRAPSRASLIIANMINDGYSYEDLLEPTEETKEHLKEVGKRFMDTMIVPRESLYASINVPEFDSKTPEEQQAILNSTEFKEEYNRIVQSKIEASVGFFNDAKEGLAKLEATVENVDTKDINELSSQKFFKLHTAGIIRLDIKQDTARIKLSAFDDIKAFVIQSDQLDRYNNIINLHKSMVDPMVTNALNNSKGKFASGIAGILNNKIMLQFPEISAGKDKLIVDAEMMNASSMLSYEIENDPEKLKYVTDLASGAIPLPENLIKDNGGMFEYNIQECLDQHKQLQVGKSIAPPTKSISK